MSNAISTTVEVRIPDWARFIARDTDGEWYAYETYPFFHPAIGEWACTGRVEFVCSGVPTNVAYDTLKELQ